MKEIIETELPKYGIFKGSKSWQDYEKAKRLLLHENWDTPREYNLIIKLITEYLGF